MNSDDFYLKICFKYVDDAFQSKPRPDLVYGDFILVNEINRTYEVRREISFSGFVLLHNHMIYIDSSGAFFIARRVIGDGYLLDPTYHYAMDYEYYLRLFRGGYTFRHSPNLMGALRFHASCKSATHRERQDQEFERARRVNLKELGMLPSGRSLEVRLALLRSLANCRRWAEKAIKGYYFGRFHRKEFPTFSKQDSTNA